MMPVRTPVARSQAARRGPRAFTLVELILALCILSLVSAAVCTMTFGALNTDRYLQAATGAQADVDLAMRRITYNIRMAQTDSVAVGSSTVTLVTQADNANGYPNGATVQYLLQADANHAGQQLLIENDPRYGGANTLARNVTTFTIVQVSGVADCYQVDLVVATRPVAERHFKVFCRN